MGQPGIGGDHVSFVSQAPTHRTTRFFMPARLNIKAVIFDCDGTLVDSETLGASVLVGCLRDAGMIVGHDVERFRGKKLADCLAEVEEENRRTLPGDFVPGYRRKMSVAFAENLKAIHGANDIVHALHGLVPICVASSGPREKIELSLSVTGMLPYFRGRIFSAYEIHKWKPDPGLFIHAANTLGVHPTQCAVIEDSHPGFQAGLAAGMNVFALQTPGVESLPPGVITTPSLHALCTTLLDLI
jgi:HAD superfamily hydrolase (TIGR01509 family)